MNLQLLWKRLLTSLATLALPLAALPAAAEPAMWVVKDADSTIYLFGTVHILPEGTKWRSAKIDAALNSADNLYLEIADISSLGAQISSGILLLRYGLSPSRPLSSKLTAEQMKSLDAAARKIGMDARSLNPMRPWLAGMLIETGQLLQGDFKSEPGPDVQLQKQFESKRTPVHGFETIGQQVKIFADLPEKDEVAYLVDTLKSTDTSSDGFDELVDTWIAGDVAKIGKSVGDDMKAQSPVLYKALVTDRNAAWAEQIEELLKGKGVTFIAVGAAHLAGPDSVQNQLKKKGINAARY